MATCNVGVPSPFDYGEYYAWCEAFTKSEYTNDNYPDSFRIYFKGIIPVYPKFDVACAKWGGTWRIPTNEECQELIDKCVWTWTPQGGHNGYRVTGPSGNSIFLPAAGIAGYEVLKSDVVEWPTTIVNGVRFFNFNIPGETAGYWSASKESYSPFALQYEGNRFHVVEKEGFFGLTIRPVTDLQDHHISSNATGVIMGHEYVDLGLSVKWATCNVGASSPLNYGYLFAYVETRCKSPHNGCNSLYYDKTISWDLLQHDAAKARWGGTWRLPTEYEIRELISKCNCEWVSWGNEINGIKVIGPNGNKIFLCAFLNELDRGIYWSSTPGIIYNNKTAKTLEFKSSKEPILSEAHRYYGFPVRPVSN